MEVVEVAVELVATAAKTSARAGRAAAAEAVTTALLVATAEQLLTTQSISLQLVAPAVPIEALGGEAAEAD